MPAVPKPVRDRDGSFLTWIGRQPCLLCYGLAFEGTPEAPRRYERSEAAHVRSRGAGGGDAGNVYPGCHFHHQQQHLVGLQTFQNRHRVNLVEAAAAYAAEYARQGFPAD